MMNKTIFFILINLNILCLFSKANEITENELIFRKWKTFGYTPYNDNLVKIWLQIFDTQNYKVYSKNEFKLNEKINNTSEFLFQSLNALNTREYYLKKTSVSFGTYNFSNRIFPINIPSNSLIEKSVDRYSNYIYIDANPEDIKMHRSELRINKISFFEGLYFTEEEAEEFVSKRTYYKYGNENIDREVYLKIYYYNDINLKPDPNSKYDKSLIGFPICVSVFQDKNYMYHIADFWNPEVTDYDKKYIMENGEWPNNKYKSNGVAALDSSIGYIDDDEENESSNEENISEINELSDLKIYFMPNKATLTTESIQKLDNIAMILHEISWNRLHIYGYSDKYEYNSNTEFDKELAEARSKMVMNYLVSKGINSSKLISIYSGYNKMNINGEIKDTERVVEFILKE